MIIEFDLDKDDINRAKHGISLALAREIDLNAALKFTDERHAYGEIRRLAMGPIAGRLHVLVYTLRKGNVRVISLRKANGRERKLYERST